MRDIGTGMDDQPTGDQQGSSHKDFSEIHRRGLRIS
jgi:hypothetical protein